MPILILILMLSFIKSVLCYTENQDTLEIDKNVEISTEKVKESKDEKPKERKIDVDDKSDVSSQETDTTASDKFGSGHIDATLSEHFFKEFFTNDEFVNRLSSEIAAQLFQLQKKEKEVDFPESDEFWKEYDDYLICTPCSHYHTRKDVPFKLRSSNKKGVRIVEKEN